jgi:hypothetical protein
LERSPQEQSGVSVQGTTVIRKLLVLTVAAAPAMAETRVSLIGGGNTVDDSQVQIESNIGWLQTIFRERDIEARTYFGAGNTGEPDVAYLLQPDEPDVGYRPHQLPDVSGSTRAPELTEALRRDLASLPAGDDALRRPPTAWPKAAVSVSRRPSFATTRPTSSLHSQAALGPASR